MITKLTSEQKEKLIEYRERYFAQATSTEPADRPRAEAAAMALAEIAGVKIKNVTWINSPKLGAQVYSDTTSSILYSLRTSLRDPIWISLRASLRASIWISFRASIWISLRDSIWDSIWNPIWSSLRDFIWSSLRDSIWNSIWSSLRNSIWSSLRDSIWSSLIDSGWLAYYTYTVDVLGVDCNEKTKQLLRLHNEIAESCFAIWITVDSVILCERPAECVVKDGKLVSIKFKGDK